MITIDRDECLNCTLPATCCVGTPRKRREKYEKYLEKKAEAERKQNEIKPRARRGSKKLIVPSAHKA